MRYEEQLDAHVQSYREELKRKECERIKKILQYLKEKKEYLSLEGHPVKRIHYSFEMVKPIYSLPLIKRLLSFDNKVELHIENIIPQRNYEISNISISEYRCSEIDTPSLSNINFDGFEFEVPNTEYIFPFSVDISTTKILFNPSFQKIDLKTFNNKGNDRNLIYRFTLPEVDTCDSIFRFTGQLYNYNKFDFKPPISKAVLLSLKEPHVKVKRIDFRYSPPEIEVKTIQSSVLRFGTLEMDNTQLCTNAQFSLKKYLIKTPEYNVDYKLSSAPLYAEDFPQPDLDFSEVLQKLKEELIKNACEEE